MFQYSVILYLTDGLTFTIATNIIQLACVLHAGPTTWNALLAHIRTMTVKFSKLFKAYYFKAVVNIN